MVPVKFKYRLGTKARENPPCLHGLIVQHIRERAR
jgi:hypothetical protein